MLPELKNSGSYFYLTFPTERNMKKRTSSLHAFACALNPGIRETELQQEAEAAAIAEEEAREIAEEEESERSANIVRSAAIMGSSAYLGYKFGKSIGMGVQKRQSFLKPKD